MSAQARYHTLVSNIGRIYASAAEGRTALLQKGLDEIVDVVGPVTANDWKTVKIDSERFLSIWNVKENNPVAGAVLAQIRDMLVELSGSCSSSSSGSSSVRLFVIHSTLSIKAFLNLIIPAIEIPCPPLTSVERS